MDRPTQTRIGNLVAALGFLVGVIGLLVALAGDITDNATAIVIAGVALIVVGLLIVGHARRPSREVVSDEELAVEPGLVEPHKRAVSDYEGL